MSTFEAALFKLWPNGDRHIPGLRAAMAASAHKVLYAYGINTKTAMLQFMAQISHECGAGIEIEENLDYTAARMTEVWPSRFKTVAEALPYAHNPKALANKVYNGRMGNALGTDDGYNYRGRGGTQVTGKEGYTKLGQKVGLDVLGNPNLVNEPERFLECAAADFILCGCLLPALSDDLYKCTLKLNGGTEGLALRQAWLGKWRVEEVEMPAPRVTPKPPPVVVPPKRVSPKPWWLAILDAIVNLFRR